MNDRQSGNIFIVSAASGTGKTTLVSRLVSRNGDIRVSVSHTTRPPRAGEAEGVHYYFVSADKFADMIGQGAFLEHAQVFGNFYGTSLAEVRRLSDQGFDVVLEIDVQGAAQVRQSLPEAVSNRLSPTTE